MSEPLIRSATAADAEAIAGLIEPVLVEFLEPDYDEQGRRVFRDFIAPPAIRERLSSGSLGWIADLDGAPLGYIERARRHIHLLFVRADWHGRGLSRRLLAAATAGLEPGILTLNASPYALPVYERLGFRATGPQAVRNGIVATPMALDVK